MILRLLTDDYANNRICIVSLIVMCIVLMCYICMPIIGISADDTCEVFILMYHNIIGNGERANKYEIRECDLMQDMERINSLHMETILPSDLIAFKEGRRTLPRRAVMLTFDDGYYSYITRLLPLLERYDMHAVVSVVGEYTALNKHRHDLSPRYTYVDYEDIATLEKSGRVEIGLHSYSYHHTGGANNGAAQRKGESEADYRARLLRDTARLRAELKSVGVTSDIYTYPFGAYSRCSDSILREVGIRCTLSCSEGINRIGRDSSLYLLRRYNRSGLGGRLEDMYPFFRQFS